MGSNPSLPIFFLLSLLMGTPSLIHKQFTAVSIKRFSRGYSYLWNIICLQLLGFDALSDAQCSAYRLTNFLVVNQNGQFGLCSCKERKEKMNFVNNMLVKLCTEISSPNSHLISKHKIFPYFEQMY